MNTNSYTVLDFPIMQKEGQLNKCINILIKAL